MSLRHSLAIAEAKSVGIKNITCSFPLYPLDRGAIMAGPGLDGWKQNADAFNKIGAACKAAGLTFAYHNHNIEFAPVGALELKGLEQPVVTWRVVWEPRRVADELAGHVAKIGVALV